MHGEDKRARRYAGMPVPMRKRKASSTRKVAYVSGCSK
jgi:hypothetical protein